MSRTLTAATALAVFAALAAVPALAQARTTAKKTVAKKASSRKAAEPETNDNLSPGQLAEAGRVFTGVAQCELRQKVDIEKIPGHEGNFKLTFDRRSYVMVPEETTTGAVRLVDVNGTMVWIQIPMKSMLMNAKEHHRLVDECEESAQLAAEQGAAAAPAALKFSGRCSRSTAIMAVTVSSACSPIVESDMIRLRTRAT